MYFWDFFCAADNFFVTTEVLYELMPLAVPVHMLLVFGIDTVRQRAGNPKPIKYVQFSYCNSRAPIGNVKFENIGSASLTE